MISIGTLIYFSKFRLICYITPASLDVVSKFMGTGEAHPNRRLIYIKINSRFGRGARNHSVNIIAQLRGIDLWSKSPGQNYGVNRKLSVPTAI